MTHNASVEILRIVIEMIKVVQDYDDDRLGWNRIHNLLDEIGPTDSYTSALVARRQRNEFKPVPLDEPPPPF